jgi:4-aminobutyrate aminotransferase-like enzyme
MAGIELRNADGSPASEWSLRVIKEMLRCGFIVLPEGEHSNVISFTPPLTISERQISAAVTALASVIGGRRVTSPSRSTETRGQDVRAPE